MKSPGKKISSQFSEKIPESSLPKKTLVKAQKKSLFKIREKKPLEKSSESKIPEKNFWKKAP